MAAANAAYYATHDPFRDFTTAPEISQVFGEILGLWAAVVWEQMGRPAPVLLAELGPGRGTLMRDGLRAVGQAAPAFAAAVRVHLVEASARLRTVQAGALPGAVWHERVEALPEGPLILLANEFLDALPIRQFVRRGVGWTERHVEEGVFVERPPSRAVDLPSSRASWRGDPGRQTVRLVALDRHAPQEELAMTAFGGALGEGEIVELNEPARALAAHLATRLARDGGAALFLDYGPGRSAPGDSLQALRDGRPADPLVEPGQADLTAHVDFQAFAEAAHGVDVHGPVPQGPFLAGLGLFQRTGRLAQTQPAARAAALVQAAQRLAEPDRMGGLFKALALCQPGSPTPPGFE